MGTTADTAQRNEVYTWLSDLESPIDTTQLAERFWGLTTLGNIEDVQSECIVWRSNSRVYPVFSVRGVLTQAHRVAARLGLGEAPPQAVPQGMVVDHVRSRGCQGAGCVNPWHLEVVTQSENMRRRTTGGDALAWS